MTILAALLLLYVLVKNAVGLEEPYSWSPYLETAWLVVGVVVSLRTGLNEQVRRRPARLGYKRDLPVTRLAAVQLAPAVGTWRATWCGRSRTLSGLSPRAPR